MARSLASSNGSPRRASKAVEHPGPPPSARHAVTTWSTQFFVGAWPNRLSPGSLIMAERPDTRLKAKTKKASTDIAKGKPVKKVVKQPVKQVKKQKASTNTEKPAIAKKSKSVRIHEVPNVVQFPSDKSASSLSVPRKAKATTVVDADEDDEDEMLSGFPGDPEPEDEDEEHDDEEDEEEEDDILSKQAIPTLDEVVKLPSSRDDASVRKRLEKAKSKKRLAPNDEEPEETGVVYVGRLPHGFFEDQLRAYFSQFGDIKRLRLSRNKNTGRSKHYGFMEFESPDVAEIVVDTMNNYLLDGHLLQLAMIPSQEVDPNLWIGANRKFRRVPMDRVERKRRSKSRSAEERAEVNRKLLQRQKKRRAALARAGIKYDFPGYQF